MNSKLLKEATHLKPTEWTSMTGLAAGATSLALFVAWWATHPTQTANEYTSIIYPHLGKYVILSIVLGWGCSWVAISLWNMATKKLPANIVGLLLVSETVFSVIYSDIYDGRWPRRLELIAIVLVLSGLVLALQTIHSNHRKKVITALASE
jgi:drug/metabolite transporter (DMT)-like permease